MNDELREKLKYLRLTGLINQWEHILELASQSDFSPVRLLEYVVEEEYKIKKENSRKLRLSRAKIPEHWVMETFPSHPSRHTLRHGLEILQLDENRWRRRCD